MGQLLATNMKAGAEMSSYPLLDIFLTTMWFFLWVLWIYLVCWIIWDIFHSPALGGWAKAGWVVLVVALPLFGVLVYLVAMGGHWQRQDRHGRDSAYPSNIDGTRDGGGSTANGGSASELAKLADLRDRNVITEPEFQQGKAKILR
jgi:Short C-terminal domain/Phospholipase_D-nuclease N-terminal